MCTKTVLSVFTSILCTISTPSVLLLACLLTFFLCVLEVQPLTNQHLPERKDKEETRVKQNQYHKFYHMGKTTINMTIWYYISVLTPLIV